MRITRMFVLLSVSLIFTVALTGCPDTPKKPPTKVSSTEDAHGHAHHEKGPHGGTIIELGTKAQFHFVVGNGNGTEDGAIQAGEFWKLQRLCQGRNGVVRVCVISDGRAESVTDCQLKRTGALVESLIRTFDISPRNIHYPVNWKM